MGIELLSWFDWTYLSRLVDILLVFFLIYRILLLVRGTRAEPMLLGLGIIVLVYIAAGKLHLATLNWLLGNFLGSVIMVIVILFQEEMRRALIKVGLISGFGADAPKALETSITEISQAAAELSQRRIGGLIVIRRDVGLEDYCESAVKIDGIVNHQLLVALFLPTSPLHDGAVMIEGDRIIAAGAVLPLTFSPNVSKSYGTRHRAAIGLSERSDALIVVVSEETGTISLIREGRISRDLDEKSLYSALHRLTVSRQQRRIKRRRLFSTGTSNAPAKVAEDVGALGGTAGSSAGDKLAKESD